MGTAQRAAAQGPDILQLPVFDDRPPDDAPSRTLDAVWLDQAASERLERVARESDLGLFMLFVAGLTVTLHRYTSAEDLALLTFLPDAPDAPPVTVHNRVAGNMSLGDVVDATQTAVLEAFTSATPRGTGTRVATLACASHRLHGSVDRPDGCELLVVLDRVGPRLGVRGEYVPSACDARLLRRLLRNIAHVVAQLPVWRSRAVAELDVLCPEERAELLALNKTATAYPRNRTVPELFEGEAARHPNAVALLSDQGRVSYRELNEAANVLAHTLRSRGIGPGDYAGLVAYPGREAITAILAIAKAGACYVPIPPRDPVERMRSRLEESGSGTVLATRARADALRWLAPERVVWIDDPPPDGDRRNLEGRNQPDDPMYVLYTSGTTGKPAGVVVEHRGVVRLVRNTNYIQFRDDDRILCWTPLDFDTSSFEMWGALLNGLTLCLGTREQLLDPPQLQACIERHRITILWLPSPLFSQLAGAAAGVFAGLRALLVGGDVVSPVLASRLRRLHPSLEIINGYGPTEGATFSTTHSIDRDYRQRVPIGRPIANSTAYVVDEAGHLQPVGVPGELLVGGDGVAKGYLNRPALTQARFFPFLDEPRVYKTGDLVRWLPDGTLDFLGRIDDQVKVRGHRIEPAEIEAQLLKHPAVQAAAVIAVGDGGDKTLCAYVVCPGEDARAVRAYLTETLPDHLVPAHVVRVERLPLSAHGKVDRRALPPPRSERGPARRLPGDALEWRMAALWREVLGHDDFGVDEDFYDVGGHSMKAMRLICLVHRECGVRLGLQQALTSITIAGLARVIRGATPSSYLAIEKQPPREFYELSVSQKRLAEMYARDPDNAAFNISHRFTCLAPFDAALAERAVMALVERHDSLRACFRKVDERYVQVIEPIPRQAIEICDLSALAPEDAERRLRAVMADEEARPVRLDLPPLYRVTLLPRGPDRFEVVWTMHHIVSDGWSMDVLQTEFLRLYASYRAPGRDAALEPLPLHYQDYVLWQHTVLADEARVERARTFWRELLRPPLRMLPLPYDSPRASARIGRRSAGYRAVLDEDTTCRLRAVARDHKTSLFLVLFAGFNRLLQEVSGQRDVITGIPSANRYDVGLKNVVGFLVDSVLIRTSVDPDEPMPALIDRVATNTLAILDHAYYPIELACSAADTTWPEVLSSFFNMATFGDVNMRVLEDTASYPLEQVQNAKLELMFYMTEYRNGVEINAHYHRELFEPATIERCVRRYVEIVESAAHDRR